MQIEWKEAKKNTYFLIFSEDDGKIIEQVYLFDRRNNTDPKDIVLYTYYSVGNTVPHTYILSSEPSDEMKSCFGACKVFCNPHMSIEDAKTFVIEQLEQAYLDAAEDCDRKIRKFADEKSEAVRKADYLRSLRVEAVFSESSTEKTIEKNPLKLMTARIIWSKPFCPSRRNTTCLQKTFSWRLTALRNMANGQSCL